MYKFREIIRGSGRTSHTDTDRDSLDLSGSPRSGSADQQEHAREIVADIHEEYLKIKTLILASNNTERPIHSLMVIGSVPGEGATTVAIILAHIMAMGNSFPTLLVDCDFRNPSVHAYLGLRNDGGFSELLSSGNSINEVIQRGSLPDLSVITAGRRILDLSNVLNTAHFKNFMWASKKMFRYVIFDAPAVKESFDGVIIGAAVDSCIMVVHADHTPASIVASAHEQLRQAQVNTLGIVLNRRRRYIPSFVLKDYLAPK